MEATTSLGPLYAAFGARLPMIDNVGRSADERDLYVAFDGLLRIVRSSHPPFACRDGCSSCCFVPPLVTGIEWRVLHRHLRELPGERLERILEIAESVRPLLPEMLRWQSAFLQEESWPAVTIQCPFLVGGRCDVYEARPLLCRGYGLTTTNPPGGTPRFFASPLAIAHVERSFPARKADLPSVEPWLARTRALNREAGGVSAWLPLWLWTHLDGKTLAAEVDLAPDFAALLTSR
jgi:Fe-S-cluster containining protein